MNEKIFDDPLGPMGPALHDLNVREMAAEHRLAQIEAEREELERECAQRRAELQEREVLARAAIQECQDARSKVMAVGRMLGCGATVAAPSKATAKASAKAAAAPAPTPARVPDPPRKRRGRPPKELPDNDPGGPPPLGVERDGPPDADELRGDEDL